ncbi:cellulose-binding protein, partial [Actinomadura rubrisoli]
MTPDPHRRRLTSAATAATMLLIGLGATAPVAAHAAQPFAKPSAVPSKAPS